MIEYINKDRAGQLIRMMNFLQKPDVGFEGFSITTWTIYLDGVKCTVGCSGISPKRYVYVEEPVTPTLETN